MLEEVEGDLEEGFLRVAAARGTAAARRRYWKEVLLVCLWHGWKHRPQPQRSIELAMWKNYLKLALRSARRHAGYSFINIGGLALGMAVALVIGLFIRYKLSYDRHLPTAAHTYRLVSTDLTATDGTPQPDQARLYPGLLQALAAEIPEIDAATQIINSQKRLVEVNSESYYIDQLLATDPEFLTVFPYRLLRGDAATALDGPGKLVLTVSEAARLFGTADPLGQVIRYENTTDYVVTGVVEDPPAHAHFHFDALRSFSQAEQEWRFASEVMWGRFWGYIYFLVHEGADPAAVARKADALQRANAPEWMNRVSDTYALEPVQRIHLYSNVGYDIEPQSNVRYLYLFGTIGVLILLIACINNMNLATSRSANRANEVGVRKVMGAQRTQLAKQFLGESVLTTVLALPLAAGLAYAVLPFINDVTGEAISFGYAFDREVILVMLGVLVLVGLMAGSYPALVLSRFRPTRVLYGRSATPKRGAWLRSSLIVVQFTASLGLVLVTLVVQRQLDYMQQKSLGFDQSLVLTLEGSHVRESYDAFMEALRGRPAIAAATSGVAPGIGHRNMTMLVSEPGTEEKWDLSVMFVDYGYDETMGLNVVQGRGFSRDFADEAGGAVVLNQAAARRYGFAEDPIGRTLDLGDGLGGDIEPTVVGMVEDFHNASMHEAIQPLALVLQPGFNWTIMVRLAPGDLAERLAAVEAVWSQFVPDRPFAFSFLDERIERQYLAEQRVARIFGVFSILAVLIACLGLFGLVAFAAASRTKEIGMRKVLGASVTSIVVLLSRDFLRLVALAFLVAAPLVYWGMDRWLGDFAYHIVLGPGVFVLAGGLALVAAWLTVGYQAIRAALRNPVESLRYE
jgi:putative ABC transport system permease protein